MNPYDHPLVAFNVSPIHGTGGFARVNLRRGKRIIEYVGPKLSKAKGQVELDDHNVYIFTLDEDYDIDGSVEWNPARFLNHSCEPKCESGIVRGRVWLYALRAIKAGEELTYNYGHGLSGYKDRPCYCGASSCVGSWWRRNILPPFANAIPSDPSGLAWIHFWQTNGHRKD